MTDGERNEYHAIAVKAVRALRFIERVLEGKDDPYAEDFEKEDRIIEAIKAADPGREVIDDAGNFH